MESRETLLSISLYLPFPVVTYAIVRGHLSGALSLATLLAPSGFLMALFIPELVIEKWREPKRMRLAAAVAIAAVGLITTTSCVAAVASVVGEWQAASASWRSAEALRDDAMRAVDIASSSVGAAVERGVSACASGGEVVVALPGVMLELSDPPSGRDANISVVVRDPAVKVNFCVTYRGDRRVRVYWWIPPPAGVDGEPPSWCEEEPADGCGSPEAIDPSASGVVEVPVTQCAEKVLAPGPREEVAAASNAVEMVVNASVELEAALEAKSDALFHAVVAAADGWFAFVVSAVGLDATSRMMTEVRDRLEENGFAAPPRLARRKLI